MKAGIFITARLGSSRLPTKHLLPVAGEPIFSFLLKRIVHEFKDEIAAGTVHPVITTTQAEEDLGFERFTAQNHGIGLFHGAAHNIPLRHLQAARHYGLETILSIDGDDVLCSTNGMRQTCNLLLDGEAYVKTADLPLGLNVQGYSTAFLEKALTGNHDQTLETDWGRIFAHARATELPMGLAKVETNLRFTLDYEEDYLFFKTLIEALAARILTISDQDLVNYVRDNRLHLLNNQLSEEYWRNFKTAAEAEKLRDRQ